MMFNKILIANRGEIACRVIATAKRMGIRTVAVFSAADANAKHVAMADEAYYIGPAPAKDSYLQGDKIIEVCLKSGAQAVHPGYGFLSENAGFAKQCETNDIVFIGPPASAITAMGSKSGAKSIMMEAGVPLVKGYHGDDQDPNLLAKEAEAIGFPVLIKATAGGGGKGMRIVMEQHEFADALESCQREALASFGDDKVLVEKYLTKPRHVEIQVFADQHGNAVHIFERDCSVQRRHQKVIEEAPAPNLSKNTRNQMGEVAVTAAMSINYVGAGTVEFLYDEDGSFYFMEMNTRLQVEHPVTELISGIDLVEWQLLVAAGEPLPLKQHQLQQHGHAFEVRIYAEDPDNDFLPATGTLHYLGEPETNQHVRIDSGVRQGDNVSIHYDPMIAKLIVWDSSRTAALARLRGALAQYHVVGTTTNLKFLAALADSEAFEAVDLDTGFIEKNRAALFQPAADITDELLSIAVLHVMLKQEAKGITHAEHSCDPHSPWHLVNGWRLNEDNHHELCFVDPNTGQEYPIVVHFRDHSYALEIGDKQLTLSGMRLHQNKLQVDLSGKRLVATVIESGHALDVLTHDARIHLIVKDLGLLEEQSDEDKNLTAPMPGTVVNVLVSPGEQVEAGTPLMILEAMKMEHTIAAAKKSEVKEILYAKGDLVEEGAELLILEGLA